MAPGLQTLLLLVLLGPIACAGGDPGDEPAGESGQVAEEAPVDETEQEEMDEEESRPYLPIAMQRSTRVETFPHEAHVEIGCRVCHQAPEGHGMHGELECAECHRSSALATRTDLASEDCMACHHGADQTRSCGACHQAVGPRTVTRAVLLDVWSEQRSVSLPFDHEVHESETCETCHIEATTMEPSVSCGSCHDEHHRPEARCMTCHAQPPSSAHDLEAHLGCAGAGCHSSSAVEELAQTRSTCLVCHQDQENHEPGQECAECHQVRPTGSASFEPGTSSPYVHAPGRGGSP